MVETIIRDCAFPLVLYIVFQIWLIRSNKNDRKSL